MPNNLKFLKKLVYQGAAYKNVVITDVFLDRISFELATIEQMGYTEYFITYSRIIEICNELNIIRTLGKGTAPNSMVNYCLDITKIDPIEEDLIFEMFLNPQKKDFRGIEIDIPKGYQTEIIENLKQKYPEYYTYYSAIRPNPKKRCDIFFHNYSIFQKHPNSVIIGQEKLTNSLIMWNEEEIYLSPDYFNDPIKKIRYDFIKFEYLNKLQLIVDEIGEEYHPFKIPLDDEKVFRFFETESLESIFLFEDPQFRNDLTFLFPNSIVDIATGYSIFESCIENGSVAEIFNQKRYGEERFIFRDYRVTKILEETYGHLVYQETFLHLSKEIAGIPFIEAETWRTKIARDKKNIALTEFCAFFADGCREHSSLCDIDIAELLKKIEGTSCYLFQKAHALSYATIAYWGMYYKTHFRKEFEKAFSPYEDRKLKVCQISF